MKKIYWTLIAVCTFFSCTQEDLVPTTEYESNDIVTMGINLSGEHVQQSFTPLTRSVDNTNIYQVKVYQSPPSGGFYQDYAYGVYDDISNIKLKLEKGYTYRVECKMWVDGKNRLGYESPTRDYTHPQTYYFQLQTGVASFNSMRYDRGFSDIFHLWFNYKVKVATSTSNFGYYDEMNIPDVESFYGYALDCHPVQDESISIDLKRVSFQVHYRVTGLTSGSLKVKLADSRDILFTPTETEKDVIYSFQKSSPVGLEDQGMLHDYKDIVDTLNEDAQIYLTWVKVPGIEIQIPTNMSYTFYRNKIHTVNINLNLGTTPTLNEEETPMGDGPNYEI